MNTDALLLQSLGETLSVSLARPRDTAQHTAYVCRYTRKAKTCGQKVINFLYLL